MKQLHFKIDSNIWLILALSIFAWGPLLTPAYFFNAHDAKHSVFFLVEFDQTFRDGSLWPRWAPDFSFGYGYPLFNLYAPLAFYAAEIVHLTGFGFTAAVKTVYILATLGAGLGMYGFVRRLYGPAAGFLAAVCYMYIPFHLVEIYVRSAYAEFVSLALAPFLFWAFTELVAAPSRRWLAAAGFVYGLLALTHHTSFFTFTPFLMIYIIYLITAKLYTNPPSQISHSKSKTCAEQSRSIQNLKSKITPILYPAAAGILGLALAAIYLIPMLTELQFVKLEQWTSGSYNYLQHFVYFSQFLSPEWGYGYAGVGLLDDFSFQLGLVPIVLLTFALVLSLLYQYPHKNTALFFIVSTLAAILMMSPLAEPLWQVVPIASLVQFPWRLLTITTFTMSVAAGALIAGLNYQLTMSNEQLTINNEQLIHNSQFTIHHLPFSFVYLLSLVTILASFSYTLPQYTDIPAWAETPLAVINWDKGSVVDRVGMVSVTDEQPQTSPMESQYLNGEPLITAGIITGEGTVNLLHHGGASDIVEVQANTPVTLQFYTYNYPGWQVTLNNQPIPHRYEPPYGLITVDLPPGRHTVTLQMGHTPPRIAGTIISTLAFFIILALAFAPRLPFTKIDNS